MPHDRALTQRNMGNALREWISGDQRENIDESIECFRRALQIYTQELIPHLWARTQACLGDTLEDRITGDRIVNIYESIDCYRRALEVYTQESMPREWALIQRNMGLVLQSVLSGHRRVNIDESIEVYRLARSSRIDFVRLYGWELEMEDDDLLILLIIFIKILISIWANSYCKLRDNWAPNSATRIHVDKSIRSLATEE